MDYKKLQNGSDIRGVALEGVAGQSVTLTEQVCRDIGRGFAVWLMKKTGKSAGLRVAVGGAKKIAAELADFVKKYEHLNTAPLLDFAK